MLTYQIPLSAAFIYLLFLSVSHSNPDIPALLAFKASSDPANSLSSWLNSSDPCSHPWLGVFCDPGSRRVTRLVLENLNLSGSTRPLTQLTHLRLLSLKHNHLSSSDFLDLSSWPNLKHLYLSHNRFSGMFPAGISRLRRLRRLDLSRNDFSGKIPLTQLTPLSHLITLHLESNSFAGELETVDSYTHTISDFNISSNNLSGNIPDWLSQFPASSFSGNRYLCGKPLPYDCSNLTLRNESMPAGSFDHKNGRRRLSNRAVITIIAVDVAAVLLTTIVTLTCCCWFKKKRGVGTHQKKKKKTIPRSRDYARKHCGSQELKLKLKAGKVAGTHSEWTHGGPRESEGGMVIFEGCNGFAKVDDLLKASAEMLGKGIVGTTYKVVMDDGDAVVVKRVRDMGRKRDIDGRLRDIGGLRHTNIVSFRAYHRSPNELLLVYDFLPNGSLHQLLHGNRGPGRIPLDWTTRLKLASDAAKGVAFLHDHHKFKVYHGHLTSSNIIVDNLGNACIADVGLHQLLRLSFSPTNAYTAPELLLNNSGSSPRKFTQKCDVYSFGVVLLEMLTGKMVTEVDVETSLVKWFQSVGREEWTWEVLDFELLRYKDMEEEMVALLQVALLCLSPLPKHRPTMSMVHRMIEDIRTKGRNSILEDLSSPDGSSPLSESTPKFISS